MVVINLIMDITIRMEARIYLLGLLLYFGVQIDGQDQIFPLVCKQKTKFKLLHNKTVVVHPVDQGSIHQMFTYVEGQKISEANFFVLISSKNRTKLLFYFCPKDLKWVK